MTDVLIVAAGFAALAVYAFAAGRVAKAAARPGAGRVVKAIDRVRRALAYEDPDPPRGTSR